MPSYAGHTKDTPQTRNYGLIEEIGALIGDPSASVIADSAHLVRRKPNSVQFYPTKP